MAIVYIYTLREARERATLTPGTAWGAGGDRGRVGVGSCFKNL